MMSLRLPIRKYLFLVTFVSAQKPGINNHRMYYRIATNIVIYRIWVWNTWILEKFDTALTLKMCLLPTYYYMAVICAQNVHLIEFLGFNEGQSQLKNERRCIIEYSKSV